MEGGVISETGLSARLNVVEEPKREPENATTLLQITGVQTVLETPLNLERVTRTNARSVIT